MTTIAIKIPASVFGDTKIISKFILQHKGTRIAKTILRKKNRLGRLCLPGCDNYSIATVVKAVWYWQKDRRQSASRSMLDRIRKPPVHPHKHDPPVTKEGTEQYNRRKTIFPTNEAGAVGHPQAKVNLKKKNKKKKEKKRHES